jgi:hypothetical protein
MYTVGVVATMFLVAGLAMWKIAGVYEGKQGDQARR